MPALRLRLRTTCSDCGNPVPLTSAALSHVCPTCDAAVRLGEGAFAWVTAPDVAAPRAPAEGAVLLGETEQHAVSCRSCEQPVDEGAIADGLSRGTVTCRCGASIGVRPVPADLDPQGWWTALVGETEREKLAPTREPVHFPCPNCGGALLVDGTTRTPPCRHCNTRAYLPEDLWRSLRPTARAEPFYLWVNPDRNDAWVRRRDLARRWAGRAAVLVWVAPAVVLLVTGLVSANTDLAWGALLWGLLIGWGVAVAAYILVRGLLAPRGAPS